MSSFFGEHIKLSLFGQSHGEAIGITLDGVPAGLGLDEAAIAREMARRAPGRNGFSTPRREADAPRILSGVLNGVTTGQPLCAIIENTNAHSADYGDRLDLVRPGHADYTGDVRYGGFEDHRGGGHFSGRLTAPIVFAGAVWRQWLAQKGVHFYAHIRSLHGIGEPSFVDEMPDQETLDGLAGLTLPTVHPEVGARMAREIDQAKERLDSVGGVIECLITGLPAGLGAPFFDSAESVLSHLMFAIPAVKAVAFGAGADMGGMYGSECNDAFVMDNGRVATATNRCGGILGGITTGMPVIFSVTIRPTPSIAQPQKTVSLVSKTDETIAVKGRHDPCILPRAVPVVEAMAALGMAELWKERQQWV